MEKESSITLRISESEKKEIGHFTTEKSISQSKFIRDSIKLAMKLCELGFLKIEDESMKLEIVENSIVRK